MDAGWVDRPVESAGPASEAAPRFSLATASVCLSASRQAQAQAHSTAAGSQPVPVRIFRLLLEVGAIGGFWLTLPYYCQVLHVQLSTSKLFFYFFFFAKQ